ncbi:probable inactive DNA (cytosine-5)-methyltransferase DRM3 isoform X2 [Dioscorea cayenensis subsp. rotundata]|uniref:Probable inactive DNA (Cytosine-5)-methyltransferase DRM3 isoform X2 n=1 Tax=Dioscorea cayennensis subsp. rotundata TaxID=55577 RepID=A0AB40D2M5_DIOCR|nr:probable inactive DNA (cytosine-5)-methyltransferase DRM3 isoform X2 [Dioscorea cayenensis subsp. rotundata]
MAIIEVEESSSSDVEIIEQDSDVWTSTRIVPAKRVKVEVSGRHVTVKPSYEPPRHTEAQQKSIFEGSESPDILISVSEESNSKLKSDMDCNQENEVLNESSNAAPDKRLLLLAMEFQDELVDLAINKLARSSIEKDITGSNGSKDKKNEGNTEETLLGKMDKTASLLDMGFSEDEIFSAIDNLGPEVPIWELADSIFANRIASGTGEEDLLTSRCSSVSQQDGNMPRI